MSDGVLSALRRPRPGREYPNYTIGYNKALDDVREALLGYKAREVLRTVLWNHNRQTPLLGPTSCTCERWDPGAESFEKHLSEELLKALAGDDE